MNGKTIMTQKTSALFKVNLVAVGRELFNNREEKTSSRKARNFPDELCREKPQECEYEMGQYWALRNRLYVKDIEGAERILSKLAKKTLNMPAGYAGQDRYYGLGAGAIAMYIMHEEKNIEKAIGYLEGAFSIARFPKNEFKSENTNALLAIIEVAAACGIAFEKLALKLAAEEFGKDSFTMGIALEKMDNAIHYRLPDY